jgi:hypothetical protein
MNQHNRSQSERRRQQDMLLLSAANLHQRSLLMRCHARWLSISRSRAPHRQELARHVEAVSAKHQMLMMGRCWQIWREWHVHRKIQYWALQRADRHYQHSVLMLAMGAWTTYIHATTLHRRAVQIAVQHWCNSKLRTCMLGWHVWVAHVMWEQCASPSTQFCRCAQK